MRQTSLDQVYELAKKDPRVVFIGSDLGQGVLQKFKEEMPERFYMEGVSEAHIIGMAAGLAMEGCIPYFNTIATFATRRCYEQVVLDLCLHNLPVRLLGSGGGLVYAPLGPTHLAIEDIAIFRTVPNMTIVAPADAEEMKRLMPLTVDHPGAMYIRLAKGGDPIVTNNDFRFEIGKAYEYEQGRDVLFITTGITLGLAQQSAKELSQKDIKAGIVHYPTIKPFDVATLLRAAKDVPTIVTIEEGVINGGLGSAVCEALLEEGISGRKKVKRIGIDDTFPCKYGSQNDLLKYHGITVEGIIACVS